MKKRGISPVVATVLLIAIVIVIGLIIFLWFRGMTEETITKFGGTNVKLVCNDVEFEASYSSGILYLSNTGNVPIYKINMKIDKGISHTTKTLEEDWPEFGLNQGDAKSFDISSEVDSGDEVLLIPVLLGNSKNGKKSFICEEEYGYEIMI